MNTSQPVIIFSAYRSDRTEAVNRARHDQVVEQLLVEGIPLIEGLGVYQGVQEQCIVVPWTAEHEETVSIVCGDYEQECYLSIGADRIGLLVYTDGSTPTNIGRYNTQSERPEGDHTQLGDLYITFR